jgi:hypothetical protein
LKKLLAYHLPCYESFRLLNQVCKAHPILPETSMSKPAFFLSVMQNFWMEEAGISVTGYALLASLCVVVSAVALLAWRSWM